ncbi:hypothetical protein BC938DRAFT_478199 [Jimgerdemannia flammicorona]|uniref:Uncharacterized protein n=1 Tax=Jimgerdemannia flammicorona TaxID=994334 RepID=A0A433QYJ9_9FUNG|nr:hypothetical protein BC938DRAFT_478199 [Jimgerdemannia flammicorona]
MDPQKDQRKVTFSVRSLLHIPADAPMGEPGVDIPLPPLRFTRGPPRGAPGGPPLVPGPPGWRQWNQKVLFGSPNQGTGAQPTWGGSSSNSVWAPSYAEKPHAGQVGGGSDATHTQTSFVPPTQSQNENIQENTMKPLPKPEYHRPRSWRSHNLSILSSLEEGTQSTSPISAESVTMLVRAATAFTDAPALRGDDERPTEHHASPEQGGKVEKSDVVAKPDLGQTKDHKVETELVITETSSWTEECVESKSVVEDSNPDMDYGQQGRSVSLFPHLLIIRLQPIFGDISTHNTFIGITLASQIDLLSTDAETSYPVLLPTPVNTGSFAQDPLSIISGFDLDLLESIMNQPSTAPIITQPPRANLIDIDEDTPTVVANMPSFSAFPKEPISPAHANQAPPAPPVPHVPHEPEPSGVFRAIEDIRLEARRTGTTTKEFDSILERIRRLQLEVIGATPDEPLEGPDRGANEDLARGSESSLHRRVRSSNVANPPARQPRGPSTEADHNFAARRADHIVVTARADAEEPNRERLNREMV